MTTRDECKKIVDKYIQPRFEAGNHLVRNKMADDIVKLLARKEKEAFDKGYEAGRWDRPTNTSGRI